MYIYIYTYQDKLLNIWFAMVVICSPHSLRSGESLHHVPFLEATRLHVQAHGFPWRSYNSSAPWCWYLAFGGRREQPTSHAQASTQYLQRAL